MRNKNLTRLLSTLTFVFTLTFLSQGVAFGQCATNGSPNIQGAGWQKGTTVKYFIDPAITDANARDAVTQAFENWNNSSSANNSGVTYELTTTRPTSGVGNYLIVNYGSNLTDPVTGAQVRAQVSYTNDPTTGYTNRGGIRMDPSMTNYHAVLETMVHEIGHPMGLGHCMGSGCTPAGSVMTPVVQNPPTPENFNRTYGRATTPTGCDNNTLMVSNYPPCSPPVNTTACMSWDYNLCTCNDYGYGGGGGGGGDLGGGGGYYCTPYYWVYYESWDGGRTWDVVDMSYAGCW